MAKAKYQCPAFRQRFEGENKRPTQQKRRRNYERSYKRDHEFKKQHQPKRNRPQIEEQQQGYLQGKLWIWGEVCSCTSLGIESLPQKLPNRIRKARHKSESKLEGGTLVIKRSQNGYQPPHLRNKVSEGKRTEANDAGEILRKTSMDGTESPSSSRSIGSLHSNDLTVPGKSEAAPVERERPINSQTGEVIVRDNNAIMPSYADANEWKEPYEWTYVCEYFSEHDNVFAELQENKETGRENKYVKTFFAFKDKHKDGSRTHREMIPALFRRFYRYAVDIDIGTQFVQNFSEIKGTLFLEFGFAPGGMSKLLLDHDPSTHGVGVTLPPETGGNVYPDDFLHHPRFEAVEADVIALASSEIDHIRSVLGTRNMNLAIIGITIHQPFDQFDHLDHQLIYSQLYLSLLYLEDGGSLLIRHKMGLSLIHTHLLILFRQLFEGEPVFHKPLTEFAIRKTYWVLWKGFSRKKLMQFQTLEKCSYLLAEVLKGNRSGYDYNSETKEYYNPCLIERKIEDIIEEHGKALLELQHPMWVCQSQALKAYMKGKRDRPCRRSRCSGDCSAAHCVDDLIPGIHINILRVNERIQQEQALIAKRIKAREEEEIKAREPPPRSSSRWGGSKLKIRRKDSREPRSPSSGENRKNDKRSQDIRRFSLDRNGAGHDVRKIGHSKFKRRNPENPI